MISIYWGKKSPLNKDQCPWIKTSVCTDVSALGGAADNLGRGLPWAKRWFGLCYILFPDCKALAFHILFMVAKHRQWKPKDPPAVGNHNKEDFFPSWPLQNKYMTPTTSQQITLKKHHALVELDSAVFLGYCTCSLNLFPVPACKSSGLKYEHTHQQKTNVFWGCNKPAFNTVHFHANLFTSQHPKKIITKLWFQILHIIPSMHA